VPDKVSRSVGSGEGSTIERRLRFIANASSLLSLGLFVRIVQHKLHLADFFPTISSMASSERLLDFIGANGGSTALSATAIYWLWAWRREYTWQLSTAKSLFPRSRVPRDLSTTVGASLWVLMAIVFNATFLALAWYVDNLVVFAAGITVISIVAAVSEWMTRVNVQKTFSDPRYAPLASDERRVFIQRRREVIEQYYFNRPHTARHALCVGLSCPAVVVALAHSWGVKLVPVGIAYVAILLVVFGNDALVQSWRVSRNRRLAAIDEEEEEGMASEESPPYKP
jgi:hypothetical protein